MDRVKLQTKLTDENFRRDIFTLPANAKQNAEIYLPNDIESIFINFVSGKRGGMSI